MFTVSRHAIETGDVFRRQCSALVRFDETREADDGVERCAQLMTHARQEVALGAIGVFRLVARFFQLALNALEIRDYSRYALLT